jgi:AcrR family transcriptional regulator
MDYHMEQNNCRTHLIAAATPLFARKGLNGVSVRELAKAAGVNGAMISYYFGGKEGLYEAVLQGQFAALRVIVDMAYTGIDPLEKFRAYIFQCGICFHEDAGEAFIPVTVSANPDIPECPKCLNNHGDGFTETRKTVDLAA